MATTPVSSHRRSSQEITPHVTQSAVASGTCGYDNEGLYLNNENSGNMGRNLSTGYFVQEGIPANVSTVAKTNMSPLAASPSGDSFGVQGSNANYVPVTFDNSAAASAETFTGGNGTCASSGFGTVNTGATSATIAASLQELASAHLNNGLQQAQNQSIYSLLHASSGVANTVSTPSPSLVGMGTPEMSYAATSLGNGHCMNTSGIENCNSTAYTAPAYNGFADLNSSTGYTAPTYHGSAGLNTYSYGLDNDTTLNNGGFGASNDSYHNTQQQGFLYTNPSANVDYSGNLQQTANLSGYNNISGTADIFSQLQSSVAYGQGAAAPFHGANNSTNTYHSSETTYNHSSPSSMDVDYESYSNTYLAYLNSYVTAYNAMTGNQER